MVGTTIRAALAKGKIVCMLLSLPSVCHCLSYFSTTLGRVIRCTKVRWVVGSGGSLLLAGLINPLSLFPCIFNVLKLSWIQ